MWQKLNTHTPVSYTHLDVYKRQINECCLWGLMFGSHSAPGTVVLFFATPDKTARNESVDMRMVEGNQLQIENSVQYLQ